jgi:hypothetical protein
VKLKSSKVVRLALVVGALAVVGAAVRRVRHEHQCQAGNLAVCAKLCQRGRSSGCTELDRRCGAGDAAACTAQRSRR